MKQPCVYILTNKRNGTLYTGVTSNLIARVCQHKQKHADGFTKKYELNILVWYEVHEIMETAIQRGRILRSGKENGN